MNRGDWRTTKSVALRHSTLNETSDDPSNCGGRTGDRVRMKKAMETVQARCCRWCSGEWLDSGHAPKAPTAGTPESQACCWIERGMYRGTQQMESQAVAPTGWEVEGGDPESRGVCLPCALLTLPG